MNFEDRPRLKMVLSKTDKILETAGWILFLIMWVITVLVFFKMPAVIPVHFDISGKPDHYGNKMILLILPLLGTVIFLGLTWLNKFPHIFNYMVTITDQNALRQYTIATQLIRIMKFFIVLIFTIIILCTYFSATHITNGLGAWFLPFVFAVMITPTFLSIRNSFKAK